MAHQNNVAAPAQEAPAMGGTTFHRAPAPASVWEHDEAVALVLAEAAL